MYICYSYEFIFTPESSNNSYSLEIPILIPLSERDSINNFENKFLDNIEIYNGILSDLKINNSVYGKTLFILSANKIKFKSEFYAKFDFHKTYIFSTREIIKGFPNYRGNYWIYYNSNDKYNASFIVSYHWGEKEFNSEGNINGKIYSNGWQIVEGKEEHTIYN